MEEKPTTLWIKPSTKKLLEELGSKGESYEEIILKLLRKENPLLDFDFKGRKLYRQGVEARPLFAYNPYFIAFKNFGRKSSMGWFYGNKNYSYWDEDIVTKEARICLEEHIKQTKTLSEIIQNWEEIVTKQKKNRKEHYQSKK